MVAVDYTKKSFTIWPSKKTDKGCVECCGREAGTCLNRNKACGSCVRIQGKYANYKGKKNA